MNLKSIILKPLFDLSDTEKEMVLEWRNDAKVRKWMHTSELIEKKNHFKFIEKLRYDKSNQYYLVLDDEKYLGVIYFNDIDNIKKSCEFGLYANIGLTGIGKILLNKICEYAFNSLKMLVLYAEVFENNRKAINLYEKTGFKKNDIKKIKNKKVICMELINEDR